jgi:hypothetical protein
LLVKSGDLSSGGRTYPAVWRWLAEQFHHPAQVLYCRSQQELIMRTTYTSPFLTAEVKYYFHILACVQCIIYGESVAVLFVDLGQ